MSLFNSHQAEQLGAGAGLACPVLVLTVRGFKARQQRIRQVFGDANIDFEFIFEFDPNELDESVKSKFGNLPAPSISCLCKHIEAQRIIVTRKYERALVVEDDCIFFNNYLSRLRKILEYSQSLSPGWLIFLGGGDNALDERFFRADSDIDLIESPITTAEAYLLDYEGCARRLKWLEKNAISLPADHLLKELDHRLGIKQFRPARALGTQGSISGLDKTALDGSRSKHSLIYLRAKFFWNRARRQNIPYAYEFLKRRFFSFKQILKRRFRD